MKYSVVGVTRLSKFCVIHAVCCDENYKVSVGASVKCAVVPLRYIGKLTDADMIGKTIVIKPFKKGDKWLDYIKFDERS